MLKVKEFSFNAFQELTYIVYDTDSHEAAIIDPGMENYREEELLDDFITGMELKIKYLILTHLHIDHLWGVPHVKEKYHLPVSAHNDGGYLGAIVDAQAQMFGLKRSPGKIVIENTLSEGDVIHLGNSILEVMHVPGHSPGGIVLYAPKEKFLISGDVIFHNSIGRTDLPGGNYNQLIKGIKNKILSLPDDTLIYPGHGSLTTVGEEKQNNPFIV